MDHTVSVTPVKRERNFHYYDTHPTAEDLMGESAAQDMLLVELYGVLRWLLRDRPCYLARNLNIYTARKRMQYPLAPDMALYDVALETAALRRLRSWRLYEENRPPPVVAIEIASDKTWRTDLLQKPEQYAAMGVHEYIVYDPNEPQVVRGSRLQVWQRAGDGLIPATPDVLGRVWSPTFESWLEDDDGALRLLTAAGERRLSEAEGERAARQQAAAAAARERAEKDRERAEKEAAWAKLRALGIDPEA